MIKILDIPITLTTEQIKNLILKDEQLNNIHYIHILNLEQKLQEFFKTCKLSFSFEYDIDDEQISLKPILLNNKSIVNNQDVVLTNDLIPTYEQTTS